MKRGVHIHRTAHVFNGSLRELTQALIAKIDRNGHRCDVRIFADDGRGAAVFDDGQIVLTPPACRLPKAVFEVAFVRTAPSASVTIRRITGNRWSAEATRFEVADSNPFWVRSCKMAFSAGNCRR